MCNTIYRYKWYLVGILKPTEYRLNEVCDTIDTSSKRFIVYDHADSWFDNFNLCVEEGNKYWNIVSYPDSLGCNLVIHVETFCTYDN